MPDYDAFVSQLAHSSSRSIDSQNPDHASSPFTSSSSYQRLRRETRAWLLAQVDLIQKAFPPESESSPKSVRGQSTRDSSIYVGCGGNAYFHWRLSRFFQAEGEEEKVVYHRKCALTAVNVALSLLPKKGKQGREIAFYLGSAGISVCMYVYRRSMTTCIIYIHSPAAWHACMIDY